MDKQTELIGYWTKDEKCSLCGITEPSYLQYDEDEREVFGTLETDYCPNCGAKMKTKEDCKEDFGDWLKELKRYREMSKKIIKEMQSKKATYPNPSKENWNKEVIARNSGIDECIEIVNNYLKGGE